MPSKFKTLIKRQFSYPARANSEENLASNSTSQEMQEIPKNFLSQDNQPASLPSISEGSGLLNKKSYRQRSRTTILEPIEDVLLCGICKGTLQSPRMMPCQHTFCLQCLKNILRISHNTEISITCPLCCTKATNISPEDLPTNLYIESVLKVIEKAKKNQEQRMAVAFEDEDEDDLSLKCRTCRRLCKSEDRCKHCKQMFCQKCWPRHTNDLKEQMENISTELVGTTTKLERKVHEFQTKVDDLKELICNDIEERIADLIQEREERILKTDEMVAPCFASVQDIKQDIERLQSDLEEQHKGAYDILSDEQQKVKKFLAIQEKAAELIATVSVWEPELKELEMNITDVRQPFEIAEMKDNPNLLYKRKTFKEKIVANYDVVQRPSAFALISWRDHLLVTCPGSGQVVLLDRKFKPLRRISHQEMMAPQGVAYLEKTEEIFVTDKWRHCIFVFNRKGELQRRLCSKGSGESQLRSPEGIAFHPTLNHLYVADTGNDRIQILENNGTYIGCIGPTNKHITSVMKSGRIIQVVVNQLSQPTDVAVSSLHVVVADCGNNKVKIFNHEGQILRTCGGLGSSKGFFKSPQAVYIDNKENIIVGDTGNGRVQIFSSSGELLRILGGKGSKIRPFGWVSAVLVKDNHEILVGDSKNNTIHLF